MKKLNLNFSNFEKESVVTLQTSDMIHKFVLCDGDEFSNRKIKFDSNNAFLFNGYSTWLSGDGKLFVGHKDFTLTVLIAPMSYESSKSGIISKYNEDYKSGFYISVKKFGVVLIGFGNGHEIFEFESIKQHLDINKWNVLTVVFNGTAGWCDLYVNGIISNRKQFPRNTIIKQDDSKCYIGKFVNHKEYSVSSQRGIFDGYLKEIEIHYDALTYEEIIENVKSHIVSNEIIKSSLDRSDYEDDTQRPKYHLIAPAKWMNETHAPLYYNGSYHIFYQANPHAPLFDNIQWGHLISEDMMQWKDLRLALQTEDNNLDPDGCWSGSSFLDKNGVPTIFYTAGNNKKFPNQGIAMAKVKDDKNSMLEYWEKEKQLIIEQTSQDGWMGEFRDPYVWLQDNVYYMLVGTGDANNGGGNAIIYSSDDLLIWNNHGFVMDYDYNQNMEVGHVWELPVLLPLKDETGEIIHYILLLCACQIDREVVETYYWIGDWDSSNKKFNKLHDKAKLIDFGNGTFTGPSGFVTPDGRSVLFTLAQGKRNLNEEFASGWAHNGGIPIELFYKNNELGIKPIDEISTIKKNKVMEFSDTTVAAVNKELNLIDGNMFYATIIADGNFVGISTIYGDERLVVYYDKTQELYAANQNLNNNISKFRGDIDRVNIGKEHIKLEYFLDHSMIEVYLNQLKSISLRNYSKVESRKLELIADEYTKIRSFTLWEMKSVYE